MTSLFEQMVKIVDFQSWIWVFLVQGTLSAVGAMSIFFLTRNRAKTAVQWYTGDLTGIPASSPLTPSVRLAQPTKPTPEEEATDVDPVPRRDTNDDWFNKWHSFEECHRIGQNEAQGDRDRMENRHRAFGEHIHHQYTIVLFDGHRGEQAAEYCRNHLSETIDEIYFQDPTINFVDCIRPGFLSLDRQLCDFAISNSIQAGAVGVFIRMVDSRIYCGNTGDCRAFLSRGAGKVIELTEEHRVDTPAEKERMIRDFGEAGYRNVTGHVAVARAFGNVEDGAKLEGLVVDPHVMSIEMADEDEFILIACDGLWDAFSKPNVPMGMVRDKLRADPNPQKIAEIIVQRAIKNCPGTCDNISVVIVAFPKRTAETNAVHIVPRRMSLAGSALRRKRRRFAGVGVTH